MKLHEILEADDRIKRGMGEAATIDDTDPAIGSSTQWKRQATQRKNNAIWAQITDYEKRAKATGNPIKRDHYMKMARELREKLPTNEGYAPPRR